MYETIIHTHFDAAHILVGYPGKCSKLHGHTFSVEVSVETSKLNEIGIAFDFKDLKELTHQIIDEYDHKFLNEIPPFNKINPTSENLAQIIYEKLEKLLPPGVRLNWVKIGESSQSFSVYRR